MRESASTESPKKTFKERMRLAGPAEGWAEHQSVMQYLRFHGKELRPTARLILLTLIGHEAPTPQVVFETGACLYAVNKGLAELTKRGLLLKECFAIGRFKWTFYRLNQGSLKAPSKLLSTWPEDGDPVAVQTGEGEASSEQTNTCSSA
jgi:hypothetical protein